MIKTEEELIQIASLYYLEEELISYAIQIQSVLSSGGDGCEWEDALEMAFNELVVPKIY